VHITRLILGFIVASLWLSATPTVFAQAGETQFLVDTKANRPWTGGKRSNEINFADGAAPELSLTMNLAAFKPASIELHIEGGPGRLELFAGTHDLSLQLTRKGQHRVTLWANPKLPTILLNRRRVVLAEAAWRSIVNDPTLKQFTFLMSNNKAMKITFSTRGKTIKLNVPGAKTAPEKKAPTTPNPVVPTTTPGTVPTTLPGGLDAQSLRRFRRSVFYLHMESAHKQIQIRVPAFLVSKSGFAITSYAPLLRAKTVKAILGPTIPPIDVELWKVAPEVGLALVRLDKASLTAAGAFEALQFGGPTDLPKKGDTMWALGPLANGAAGAVSVQFESGQELTDLSGVRFQSLDDFPRTSRWWVLNKPLSAEVAGGPLINEKGKILGIAAWAWTAPNVGKSAKGHALFMGIARDMATNAGNRPLSFSKAYDQYSQHKIPQLHFPSAYVKRRGTSAVLRQTATGLYSAGMNLVAAKLIAESRAKTVRQMAEKMAMDVTLVDSTDANRQAAYDYVAERLGKLMAAGKTKLVGVFNRRVERLLANSRELALGEAVTMVGRTAPAGYKVPGMATQPRVVSFQGSKSVLLFREMDLEVGGPSTWVIAGGVFVGHVKTERGQLVPVIQRGFIAKVPGPGELRR
jgi:hypothetical protein